MGIVTSLSERSGRLGYLIHNNNKTEKKVRTSRPKQIKEKVDRMEEGVTDEE